MKADFLNTFQYKYWCLIPNNLLKIHSLLKMLRQQHRHQVTSHSMHTSNHTDNPSEVVNLRKNEDRLNSYTMERMNAEWDIRWLHSAIVFFYSFRQYSMPNGFSRVHLSAQTETIIMVNIHKSWICRFPFYPSTTYL